MTYRITVIEHSIGPWDWRVHIPGRPDEYVASGTARTRRKARKAAVPPGTMRPRSPAAKKPTR